MKILKLLHPAALLLIAALSIPTPATAQGTAITYQGRLSDNAGPVNGSFDCNFQLFDAASGGVSQGSLLTKVGVPVSDGLFTVTLDFGSGPFTAGAARWLEISVRTNGSGAFGLISPRLELTATPYAVMAGNISGPVASTSLAGTYSNALTLNNPANVVSGAFTGNGANVTNVNAATLSGLTSGSFWKTNGNAGANPTNGAFLGTTDNFPLEIKVNGQRAFRFESATNDFAFSPNLIGGYSGNQVSNGVVGAFIGGGGYSFSPNRVAGHFAAVLGGIGNIASGFTSAAIGQVNTVSGNISTAIGGGNTVSGVASTAVGTDNTVSGGSSAAIGSDNDVTGDNAIAIGRSTTASGVDCVAIGFGTTSSGDDSMAMGRDTTAGGSGSMAVGTLAKAMHAGSFVWADRQFTDFVSTASNQFLIRASGGVGIGTTNPASRLTVGGAGNFNTLGAAAIMLDNRAANGRRWEWHSLDDGRMQLVDFDAATTRLLINSNGLVGLGTAVPTEKLHVVGNILASGTATAVAFNGSFVGNGASLSNLNASQLIGAVAPSHLPANLVTNGQSGVNFAGTFSGDGSGLTNLTGAVGGGASSSNAWLLGGNNVNSGQFLGTTNNRALEFVVNGQRALRIEPNATSPNIVGGYSGNVVSNGFVGATIVGGGGSGGENRVGNDYATVLGGGGNIASGFESTAMGVYTTASGYRSTAMGDHTTASGDNSIAMGANTLAGGDFSTTMGYWASATNQGTFVWADHSSGFTFASTADNQFLIRAVGGVGIGTTAPEAPFHVAEGSAGTVAANANAIAVFERAGNAYLSVLTPTNSESGVLFGTPTSSVDGGVLFNANVARGLSFRTGGNSTKMVIQADGFVGIGTQAPTERLHVIGNILASGTVTGSSDRNVKRCFAPVNSREVLDKVSALPISTWSYIADDGVRHLGPMAQDFYSAFSVGMDDKHISMVDADGVALAAIQGLNQKVEEKDSRIRELEKRIEKLEQLINLKSNEEHK